MMVEKIIATEDLFLNADKTAVVFAGPDAAFLLVRAGKQVPPGYAQHFRLLETEEAPVKKAVKKPAGKKARKKPADKARKTGEDK